MHPDGCAVVPNCSVARWYSAIRREVTGPPPITASISGKPYFAVRTTDCGEPPTPTQVVSPASVLGKTSVRQRRPHGAAPGDGLLLHQLRASSIFFLEEDVVGEVVAEQRERLGERAAPQDDWPAVRVASKAERRETLEDADRVVSELSNCHAGAELEGRCGWRCRPARSRASMDVLRAVVLTEREGVDADLVGEDGLPTTWRMACAYETGRPVSSCGTSPNVSRPKRSSIRRVLLRVPGGVWGVGGVRVRPGSLGVRAEAAPGDDHGDG